MPASDNSSEADGADDSLPPLEYVGPAGSCPEGEALRPGDQVRLGGLTKAELNDQCGTIMPFTNSQQLQSGRLPVKLASSKVVSVRRENLTKVSNPDRSAVHSEPGGDIASDPSRGRDAASGGDAACFGGGGPSAFGKRDCADGDDASSHGSLPPLEYVGTLPSKWKVGGADSGGGDASSDDSMPPLEPNAVTGSGGGGFANAPAVAAESVPVTSHGEDVGVASAPPEVAGASPRARNDDASSDDSMPPLEYVGDSLTAEERRLGVGQEDPPSSARSVPFSGPSTHASAGSSGTQLPPSPARQGGADHREDRSGEGFNGNKVKEVGGRVDLCEPSALTPGDSVILHGLSNQDLNGKRATVLPSSASPSGTLPAAVRAEERVPVQLCGSERRRLAVRRRNLLVPKSTVGKADECSDDSMPPLEHSGIRPPTSSVATATLKDPADDSDDSMPPLEHVGARPPASLGAAAMTKDRGEESDDSMPPLEYDGTRPPTSSIAAALPKDEESDDSTPPLEHVANSAQTGPPQTAPTPLPGPWVLASETNPHITPAASTSISSNSDIARTVATAHAQTATRRPKEAVQSHSSAPSPTTSGTAYIPETRLSEPPLAGKTPTPQTKIPVSLPRQAAISQTSPPVPGIATVAKATAGAAEEVAASRIRSDASSSLLSEPRSVGSRGDKNWVVLTPSDVSYSCDRRALDVRSWCEVFGLPAEFAMQLEDEDVKSPMDLACLPQEDLLTVSKGLKLGAKGRFLAAVKQLQS
eukprot:TRINITY_DN40829_c0_g1_i1.p1 TRINITY_DN40829_c0_g1~~TRINITY_DN40829_c0_g1_i1.p1  ORF type:complete len:758 (-),score=168.42 TRINITY_DN40829_c0_g1_i1:7-2280(-)